MTSTSSPSDDHAAPEAEWLAFFAATSYDQEPLGVAYSSAETAIFLRTLQDHLGEVVAMRLDRHGIPIWGLSGAGWYVAKDLEIIERGAATEEQG